MYVRQSDCMWVGGIMFYKKRVMQDEENNVVR